VLDSDGLDIWDFSASIYTISVRCPLAEGVIFVVGANTEIEEDKDLLRTALSVLPTGLPVLVMANKQDLAGAQSVTGISDKLALHSLVDRKWYVQGTSAKTGEGLKEGIAWLLTNI